MFRAIRSEWLKALVPDGVVRLAFLECQAIRTRGISPLLLLPTRPWDARRDAPSSEGLYSLVFSPPAFERFNGIAAVDFTLAFPSPSKLFLDGGGALLPFLSFIPSIVFRPLSLPGLSVHPHTRPPTQVGGSYAS